MKRISCEYDKDNVCTITDRWCLIGDKLARGSCGIALSLDRVRIRKHREINQRHKHLNN